MPRTAMRRVAIAVLAACASPALALQADMGFGLGAEYSDNINLAPEGQEEDASVALAEARLRLAERTGDVEANLAATLQYRDYQTDTFDDELLLVLDGSGVWTLQPGRLTWHLDDHFEQATVNVFAAPTPENRQDTNVLSTGPEARLRLSGSQSFIVGGRYGNFYFEESDADSHRFSGYGRWLYAMTPRRDLSANVEASVVRFPDDAFDDYNRTDGFLRLTNRWARSTLEADAGKTFIDRDRFDDVDGFLGRLGFHMDFNSYSGIDAYLLHQYTDVGHDILDTAMRDGAVGVINEQITGDVFYNRQAELAYRWQGVRTHWRVVGAVREEDYESLGNDRIYEEGQAAVGYDLTPTLRVGLSGLYRRADYRELDQINTDRVGAIHFAYQLNSRLAATLELTRNERDSSLAGAAYEENRAMLMFSYERAAGPAPADAEE